MNTFEEVARKFVSGNSVPVERAVLTSADWKAVDARIAELTAEVIQVRSEFAEGQGEYEQLDRLMQDNERNMRKRIDKLQDELAQYKDNAERGDWIIRNASWMRYEDFTAMYVELPMDVRLESYALRQDAIDIARTALKEGCNG